MKTKKQQELINTFLSLLDDEIKTYYHELILYLSEFGYHPHKQRSFIVFKHDMHNKQIAKIGIKKNKEQTPFFALRFSACQGYSQKFSDIVSAVIVKYPARVAQCSLLRRSLPPSPYRDHEPRPIRRRPCSDGRQGASIRLRSRRDP